MPTDNPEDKKSPPENPIPKGQDNAVGGTTPQGSEEEIKSSQQAPKERRHNKPHVINVGKLPPINIADGNEAKTANRISRYAIIVNSCLLFATAWIAYISFKQAISADNAAKIADKTYKADSANNERMFKLQKDAGDSSDKEIARKRKLDDQTFKLQDSALKTQITSLKETQKEFENSHSPYLEITKYSLPPAIAGINKLIAIDIQNQGAQTAEIFKTECEVRAFTQEKTYKYVLPLLSYAKSRDNNLLSAIAPGKALQLFQPLDSVSDADMKEVENGKKNLFIRVVVYYFNPSTHTKMKFETISQYIVYGQERISTLYRALSIVKK